MRTPAFEPGTRVLVVDQWVETGGTMGGGVERVESQGGVVAGLACVSGRKPARRQIKPSVQVFGSGGIRHLVAGTLQQAGYGAFQGF